MSLFLVYSLKKRRLDLGVWWGTYLKIQVAEVDNEKISINMFAKMLWLSWSQEDWGKLGRSE